jgi:HSP20 family molecular chaperone IbpA
MQVSDLSVAKPRFDNGLLKVTLPKRSELVGEQRKIEIKKN